MQKITAAVRPAATAMSPRLKKEELRKFEENNDNVNSWTHKIERTSNQDEHPLNQRWTLNPRNDRRINHRLATRVDKTLF